jgi:endonuclease/exonuclease/phosphatase (EEP) superfamily protein YafD
MLILTGLCFLLSLGTVLVLTFPHWFQLNTVFGFAQVVSFRMIMCISFLCVSLAVFLVSFIVGYNWELGLRVGAAIFLCGSIVNMMYVSNRGLQPVPLPETQSDTITVLEWNVLYDTTEAPVIVELIEEYEPDFVALPEGTIKLGEEVVEQLEAKGIHMELFPADSNRKDYTLVLVNKAYGDYRLEEQISETGIASIVVEPVDQNSGKPVFLGIHTMSPSTYERMKYWREDIDWVKEQCGKYPNAIFAGDFNQTVDHWGSVPVGCVDVAVATKQGSLGTWPSKIPQILGTPIDHILFSIPNAEAVGFKVIDVDAPSDHRPIVGKIRVPLGN